ncbi:hypothetical protein [Pseudoalteromonas spongiae]|uniref:Uncharacterized protein n=1 Tax=Pseudoalteromonas spongiae TaxID=298657 RepID=A0ABU8EW26_9GAMM
MISHINSYDTKKEAEEIIANTAKLAQKFITSSRFADVTVWDYSKQSLFNFEEYLIHTYFLPKAFKLDFTDDEIEGYISYIAEVLLRLDFVTLTVEKYSYKDYLKKGKQNTKFALKLASWFRMLVPLSYQLFTGEDPKFMLKLILHLLPIVEQILFFHQERLSTSCLQYSKSKY